MLERWRRCCRCGALNLLLLVLLGLDLTVAHRLLLLLLNYYSGSGGGGCHDRLGQRHARLLAHSAQYEVEEDISTRLMRLLLLLLLLSDLAERSSLLGERESGALCARSELLLVHVLVDLLPHLVVGRDGDERADLLVAAGVRTLDRLVVRDALAYAHVAAHKVAAARHEHRVLDQVVAVRTPQLGRTLAAARHISIGGRCCLLLLAQLLLGRRGTLSGDRGTLARTADLVVVLVHEGRLVLLDYLSGLLLDVRDHVAVGTEHGELVARLRRSQVGLRYAARELVSLVDSATATAAAATTCLAESGRVWTRVACVAGLLAYRAAVVRGHRSTGHASASAAAAHTGRMNATRLPHGRSVAVARHHGRVAAAAAATASMMHVRVRV